MTEQQRPDEDVEGHGYSKPRLDPDAPEGSEEDVEGHARMARDDADDVEGHHVMWKQDPEASEDDVEGHGQRGL
jgi:hypothetical protein